jgi:sulfur-carrier protein
MIRVVLPYHLRTLARLNQEIDLQIEGAQTIDSVVQALESSYPMLRGTIIDQITRERRPFIRFFASGEDLSLEPISTRLPERVVAGKDPFRIVGAMAGG